MTSYFIFKKDNRTGKIINICGGSHKTERECLIHWQSYLYGFADGATELLGGLNFEITSGFYAISFRFVYKDKMDFEYFMLLDKAGHDMIQEISK